MCDKSELDEEFPGSLAAAIFLVILVFDGLLVAVIPWSWWLFIFHHL